MESLQRVLSQQPSPMGERNIPPDIMRLLEILARIERRRQERLRAIRVPKKS